MGTISQENSWPDRFEVLEKVIEKEQASLYFSYHSLDVSFVWPMTVTKTHWNKMQCPCRPQPCGLGVPTQSTYHWWHLRVRVKFTVCFLIFFNLEPAFLPELLSGLTAFCSRPLLASSGLNSGLVCPPHSLCPSCTRCGPLRTSPDNIVGYFPRCASHKQPERRLWHSMAKDLKCEKLPFGIRNVQSHSKGFWQYL